MLPRNLGDVDEGFLNELCASSAPESQILEFKRELPPADEAGRAELAKDICAIANADGGDIVYGVAEAKGCASQVHPIKENADALTRRIVQTIEARIQPRLTGVNIHPVLYGEGLVLIVRVPASFDGPHRFTAVGGDRKFVARVGTVTSELSYEQLRSSFDRTATLTTQANSFRNDRLSQIRSNQGAFPLTSGPKCVVHLIPIAAMSGRTTVDVRALHSGNFQRFINSDWGGGNRTLNLEGLIVHPGGGSDDAAYTQIFRRGAFESVRVVRRLADNDDGNIPSGVITNFIRNSIQKFLEASREYGIQGPAVLGVSLLECANYRLGIGRQWQPVSEALKRDSLILPEVWIDDIASAELDGVARPLLDILWQCFGIERCEMYNKDEVWAPSTARW